MGIGLNSFQAPSPSNMSNFNITLYANECNHAETILATPMVFGPCICLLIAYPQLKKTESFRKRNIDGK